MADVTGKKAKQKEAYEAFLAYIYIENADKNKYKSFVRGLSSQHALGQNQYPKDLEALYSALGNHQFDPNYYKAKKRHEVQHKTSTNTSDSSQTTLQEQHISPEEVPQLSFAQMET